MEDQKNDMWEKSKILLELGWRIVVMLGMVGLLYLNANYPSRVEVQSEVSTLRIRVDSLERTIISLEKTMAIIVEQNKINSRQDTLLADHEIRLRAEERISAKNHPNG